MKNPLQLSLLEADFFQYYHIDIYDFIRGKISCRRVCDLLLNLPDESRLLKRIRNDPMTSQEHLMMSVVDALDLLNYQTYYVAASNIGKDYRKAWGKAPKPGERPTYEKPKEEKPKKVFTDIGEVKRLLGNKTRVIAHSPICIASKINEGGGEVRCSCPERERKTEGV